MGWVGVRFDGLDLSVKGVWWFLCRWVGGAGWVIVYWYFFIDM